MPERFEKIIAGGFLLGVVVCVFIISLGSLTNKEGAILSLLLTILSVIASWIFARLYAESQHSQAISEVKEMHNENLRTYALKAAEKVNNLSLQLNRLSVYIEEELQNSDYESDSEALSAKEERLESAIHIIAMLKSVNDTSLSDWQGVIGDEIEEQREEQEERVQELEALVEKVERLWSENKTESVSAAELNNKINSLRKEIKVAVGGFSGSHLPTTRVKKKVRREIEIHCPSCGTLNPYVQRARTNSVKNVVCQSCSVTMVSRYVPDTDDFKVDQAGPKEERLSCPNQECKQPFKVMLDVLPHSKSLISCDRCSRKIGLKRKIDGSVSVSLTEGHSFDGLVDEEFITQVDQLLPEQPWPKDVHKAIAATLNSSNAAVQKAIRQLIIQGKYKEQIDGVLYELKECYSNNP